VTERQNVSAGYDNGWPGVLEQYRQAAER